MNSEILTPFELRRYSEQINLPSLGVEGQEKFKKTKVLVIGAGGMEPRLFKIFCCRYRKIGICDNDLVDITIYLSRDSMVIRMSANKKRSYHVKSSRKEYTDRL